MKKELKILSLFVLILTISGNLIAQDFTENIIPPSPEISSLGRYLDFPISYYTGQANISIPIHTIKAGDIELPISISYHSGGIVVSDVSSWVGSGWSLNYGGFVNRSINGQPDGERQVFFPQFPYYVANVNEERKFRYAALGNFDSQHDIYNFSASGYSGKFLIELENGGRVVQIPKQNITIETQGGLGINHNDSFVLKTPNGLVHTFDEIQNTTSKSYCSGPASGGTKINKSSWRPSRIFSSSTNQFIDFSYISETIFHNNPPVYKEYDANGTQAPPYSKSTCTSSVTFTGPNRISQIEGSDGTVIKFIAGQDRKDLEGSKLLSKIEVYFGQKKIKEFIFNHKYLNRSNNTNNLYNINDNDLALNNQENRLFLMSIQEKVNNQTKPAYIFEYNLDKGLPKRFSKAIDYWGYYNGENNKTLIPTLQFGSKLYQGGRRQPNLDYAKQGSLKKIIYPTGGSTTYEYELNECTNTSFNYYTGSQQDYYEEYGIFQNDPENEVNFTINSAKITDFQISFTEDDICPSFCSVDLGLYKYDPTSNRYRAVIAMSQTEVYEAIKASGIYKQEITLSAGIYRFTRVINDPSFQDDEYFISAKWLKSTEIPEPEIDNKAGGLRVSTINTFDPTTDKNIIKKIKYESGALSLSGIPSFKRGKSFATTRLSDEGGCHWFVVRPFLERSSTPNYALSRTNGGIVGYGKVTVSEGTSNENGSTEYEYITYRDHSDYIVDEVYSVEVGIESQWTGPYTMGSFGHYGDFSSGDYEYPNPPIDNKDWKRGLLKRQSVFDKDQNLVEKKEIKYRFFDDPSHPENYDLSKVYFSRGIAVDPEEMYICDGRVRGKIYLQRYQIASTWYEIAEEITTKYTSNGQTTYTTKYDEYNPDHLMPTKITTVTSNDNTTTIQETLYPQDLSSDQFGSNLLKINHILSKPLVTKVSNQRLGLLSKQETFYGSAQHLGGVIMPYKQINYPKATATNPIEIDFRFDQLGKLLDISDPDERGNVSYRWGYSNTLPVIKIENPQVGFENIYESASVLPQGYDSLEELVSNLDDIATNRFKQNLWKTYNENLRNHSTSQNAMITTYTYKPLIGITSTTDSRGYTTYFLYDEFNRLAFVKDAQGNLVSENKYNYKN